MSTFCKHYTGLHRSTCDKGHVYEKFGRPFGLALAIPCILREGEEQKPCADREFLTLEEETDIEEAEQKIITAIFAVRKAILKGNMDKGKAVCPKCGKDLFFSRASNGRIWACCETPDCISWLE